MNAGFWEIAILIAIAAFELRLIFRLRRGELVLVPTAARKACIIVWIALMFVLSTAAISVGPGTLQNTLEIAAAVNLMWPVMLLSPKG